MVKGFRQIAFLTAISRVFGMLRDMAFSYFLGAGTLFDSWVIAFKIPNLARRIFGEGAASASFIPVYSEQLQIDKKNAQRLASTVVTVIFVILSIAVLIGLVGILVYYKFFSANDENRRMLGLTAIMLPYMIMICVVAIIAGVLNSHRHFATPALAPIVLNIFIIASLCITGWAFGMKAWNQVFVVAVCVLFAGVAQIAIQFPPLRASGVKLRPAWDVHTDAFKKIITMMGPMIIGLTVTQVNTLADDLVAKCLSGSLEKGEFFTFFGKSIEYPVWAGSVSYLYYAQRLYQLPLGVFGISLATAIFPVMSAQAASKDYDGLAKSVSRGIGGTVFLAVPAMAGLFLVGRPLVSAIFQHGEFNGADANATAFTLCFYAIGLTGFFSQQILTRAFYSMQDSRTPMRSALVAVCVNIVLNLTLIWYMGVSGLALSTAICSYLQVVILIWALRRRIGHSFMLGLPLTVAKTFVSTGLMAAVSGGALYLMRDLPKGDLGLKFDILRLSVVVLVSVVVYYYSSVAVKNDGLLLVIRREL
ncbi:MAG: murein biosynthesis integral membrane protein MurJ [Phycisphaerae bacterium]|nr:murein biosynthesis integral membrane protein MurJ [Phycisphaerae bacterium]